MTKQVTLPKCRTCKNEFVPKRYVQKFCSDHCKDQYHNERKKKERKRKKKESNGSA